MLNNTRRCGLRQIGGFTLIELMIVVAILGILAVVAIPAFVRYMRIAKTAEAYRNVNKIAKGLMIYYTTPKMDTAGQPLPCQFPHGPGSGPGVPENWTPVIGSCCTDGEPDGKCEPNEKLWADTAWGAMLFKLADKHYYSYSGGFHPNEAVATTRGAAGAIGDLDCDGTYATFGQYLYGTSNGPNGTLNCVTSQSVMVTFSETE